jgi:hypothetical protein
MHESKLFSNKKLCMVHWTVTCSLSPFYGQALWYINLEFSHSALEILGMLQMTSGGQSYSYKVTPLRN